VGSKRSSVKAVGIVNPDIKNGLGQHQNLTDMENSQEAPHTPEVKFIVIK
jgi:hypothetical protein